MANTAIEIYLVEIGKHPLLTKEQEVELARCRDAGDKSALKKLIESNLRLVVKFAKLHRCKAVELLDRIQDGNIGLLRAAEMYDGERGYRFSTYASHWIWQSIDRGAMNSDRVVRLPIHVQKEIKRMKRLLHEGKTVSEINEINTQPCWYLQTIDAPSYRIGDPHDRVADPKNFIKIVETEQTIEQIRAQLDFIADQDLERDVVIYRKRTGIDTGESRTLASVGNDHGITRERVRQICMEVETHLKEAMQDHICA